MTTTSFFCDACRCKDKPNELKADIRHTTFHKNTRKMEFDRVYELCDDCHRMMLINIEAFLKSIGGMSEEYCKKINARKS